MKSKHADNSNPLFFEENTQRRFSLKSYAGFTLVELLLAIILLSIISVALYSSLDTGIKIHRKGVGLGSEYYDTQLFFYRIARDLRTAAAMDNIYLVEESERMYFFSCQPMPGGGSQIYKITYNWMKERGDYFKLFRLKEDYADSLQANNKQGEEFLDKVLKLDFSYGYSQKTEMQTESFLWKDEWKEKAFPQMIRIRIKLPKGNFQRIVYCPTGKLAEIKEE